MKAKFVPEAIIEPTRFYRHPRDVTKDRRLTDEERREILWAWRTIELKKEVRDQAVFDEIVRARLLLGQFEPTS